ncbi:MAG: sigma-70 family RNA polymerase sigma factor [Planctomycetes bacterium]|nr:sigma-70 family RNA polymerase sigma factor [Planctomycetota bacterium]
MPASDRAWRERGLHSAVLAGDEDAWRTLYDESFAALDAFVLWRSGGLRDLADEIVQETWLTAVRRIRDFKPEQAAFVAWLRGIAANLIHNHWRRKRPPLAVSRSSREENDRRDQAEHIAHALAELPERYEAVLRAKYLDQESVQVIARAWNESPKAIESLLTRARQALREVFEKQGEKGRETAERASTTQPK